MRLIFIFTSDRPSREGSRKPWNPRTISTNFYATNEENGLLSEGYLYLLNQMLQHKIVEEIIIFIESSRGCGHTLYFGKIKCYVIPEIWYANEYIRKGDIIFVRGGFRGWYNFLLDKKEKNHWLLLYAANTGRARWKFWNIVFDDLINSHFSDARGRFFYAFKKPVNPDIFFPTHNVSKEFDVCVGASHVHDRKAQWKTVEVIATYKRLFGETLRCILPGRISHGVKTNLLRENINSARLDVALPGMVSRDKVREFMNKSHLFVYMGMGGQNDRGPLESLQCGTPVIISNSRRHCPTVYQNENFCTVIKNWNDNDKCAIQFKEALDRYRNQDNVRKECSEYFRSVNGVKEVIIPEMEKLFKIIKDNPNPDIEVLVSKYENI